MDSIAIIAEYNPFHKGHKKMIDILRKTYGTHTIIIVLMSGSFVQRGEPALFDKWKRAAWAVSCGADCVFELPCAFVLNGAEAFAAGGIRLAAQLGCTAISCGMEHGSASDITALAEAALSLDVKPYLAAGRLQGTSYGTALTQALTDALPQKSSLLQYPNTLLALEYVKAIKRYAKNLQFLPVKRTGTHNAQDLTTYASASLLRQAVITARSETDYMQYIPEKNRKSFQKILANQAYCNYFRYQDLILYESRRRSPEELGLLPAFQYGIENRWKNIMGQSVTWQSGIEQLKTRRYPFSRLCRMGAYTVLGITKNSMLQWQKQGPQYARLLALSSQGRQFIHETKKNATLPIVNKITQSADMLTSCGRTMLALDILASDIQQYCFTNPALRFSHTDYHYSPAVLPVL